MFCLLQLNTQNHAKICNTYRVVHECLDASYEVMPSQRVVPRRPLQRIQQRAQPTLLDEFDHETVGPRPESGL